jgi:hypothetical protein
MGFETKVLNAVRKELPGVEAYFYDGTLCVDDVSEDTAKGLLNVLRMIVLCDIKLSNIVTHEPTRRVEFLYDFVPFA